VGVVGFRAGGFAVGFAVVTSVAADAGDATVTAGEGIGVGSTGSGGGGGGGSATGSVAPLATGVLDRVTAKVVPTVHRTRTAAMAA
jgi:hypothetical protein